MSKKTIQQLYAEHTGKMSDKWSSYLIEYDRLFADYCKKTIRLLEIGIQNGGSLEIWSNYFSNASILIGCDINQDCTRLSYEDSRIEVIIGDVNDPDVHKRVFQRSPAFDIIIDDGSHMSKDIIKSFASYFPLIVDGGVFIVEDLHCSYWEEFEGGLHNPYSSFAFFKRLGDIINYEHWRNNKPRNNLVKEFKAHFGVEFDDYDLARIHSIEFVNSLCIIKKLTAEKNVIGKRIIAGSVECVTSGWHKLNATSIQDIAMDISDDEHLDVLNLANHVNIINQTLADRDGQIANLNQALAERDEQMASLNQAKVKYTEALRTIEEIRGSSSWRITAPMRYVSSKIKNITGILKLLPSLVRFGGGVVGSFSKARSIFSREGWNGVKRRIIFVGGILPGICPRPTGIGPANPTGEDVFKQKIRDICEDDLDAFLASNGRIKMPLSDSPEVSVLLVLFNQAELTFHCLTSLQSTLDLPAEVIIVDNASTDRTAALLDRVDGASILKKSDNMHFLHGVNSAAEKARGKYLLLLNNDTRVKAGSITAAYQRLEEEKSIGAVGGKIVLLNGTLQEAGSIIWRDGTCLGYGRGRDPGDAEFQFRRDVDYCSGALLMVRRDLFEYLGRFDEKFAPAYYEETDLCMRIREAGLRVVYDPNVEITHFEFGSSATSDAGIALQQRNRNIFINSHRSALAAHHLPSDTRHLDARMRMQNIGRVLVVDDRVPFPSLGAGYPRASHIIKAIIKSGWFVTHYPLMFPDVRFTDAYALFPREVEILAGLGRKGLVDFLHRRAGYYDTVIVSRPHNMDIFGLACRIVPEFLAHTPLIYDAEAVFAAREAILPGRSDNGAINTEDQRKITEEIALANQAKIVLTVNEIEAGMFRKAGNSDVRVIGHALDVAPTAFDFASRRDFLFVGALDDDVSPNTDSLVWFVNEVMPRLDYLIGNDYVLNVVGRSGSPKVRALSDARVRLLGRIENIRSFYNSSRVFIAPTRYAGGIPFKVHEAASMGLPVVATSLLCRQLAWTNGTELLTADTPEDFALACRRLYDNCEQWIRVREAALARVAQDCRHDHFAESIKIALRDAVCGTNI